MHQREREVAKRAAAKGTEWVGGNFRMPAYVTGEGEPYRPHSVIWMVPPDGPVLGATVAREEELHQAIRMSFREATRRPMVGPPSTPARVRVASREMAEALREEVGSSVEVVLAPTPEIDSVAKHMGAHMRKEPTPDSEASYLDGKERTPALMRSFFEAAAALYRLQPWEVVPSDSSVFLVSVEKLGVREVVISVIGQLGESLGFLVFKSLDAFAEFRALAVKRGVPRRIPGHFALNFERGADIEPALRAEVSRHGWAVAGPNAYPEMLVVDPDLVSREPTAEETTVAEALCRGLAAIVSEPEELLGAWDSGSTFQRNLTVDTSRGSVEMRFSTRSLADIEAAGRPTRRPR